MTTPIVLPDTLSGLIRVALVDLAKVEANDEYDVNMNVYHSRTNMPLWGKKPKSKCAVCFAGAVIAMSLNAKPDEILAPIDFDDDIRLKLRALDAVRGGLIHRALEKLCGEFASLPVHIIKAFPEEYCRIPEYELRPAEFKAAMEDLAKDLEEAGL